MSRQHLIQAEREAVKEYGEAARNAGSGREAELYRHIQGEERRHEKELTTMSKDYQPATSKSIADVQRANDEFYGTGAKDAPKKELSVPEQHQLKVAQGSLRMHPAMLGVMGGPSKGEAQKIVTKLTGKKPKDNLHAGSSRRLRAEHLREGEQGRDAGSLPTSIKLTRELPPKPKLTGKEKKAAAKELRYKYFKGEVASPRG